MLAAASTLIDSKPLPMRPSSAMLRRSAAAMVMTAVVIMTTAVTAPNAANAEGSSQPQLNGLNKLSAATMPRSPHTTINNMLSRSTPAGRARGDEGGAASNIVTPSYRPVGPRLEAVRGHRRSIPSMATRGDVEMASRWRQPVSRSGNSTASIVWMIPLLAGTSVTMMFAPSTVAPSIAVKSPTVQHADAVGTGDIGSVVAPLGHVVEEDLRQHRRVDRANRVGGHPKRLEELHRR